MFALCAVGVLSLLACACSAEDRASEKPECIELSASCDPLYPPEFDQIFTRTLKPTCAQGGGSCHGPGGAQGGLIFAEPDESYELLKPRLVAGDAACSELVVRTHDVGKSWSMPPGQPLSEAERCVIRRWVEQGAVR